MKTSIQKGRKLFIFPMGLVHGSGQKFEISSSFLFGQIDREKVLGDALH